MAAARVWFQPGAHWSVAITWAEMRAKGQRLSRPLRTSHFHLLHCCMCNSCQYPYSPNTHCHTSNSNKKKKTTARLFLLHHVLQHVRFIFFCIKDI